MGSLGEVRFGAFRLYLPSLLEPQAQVLAFAYAELASGSWRPDDSAQRGNVGASVEGGQCVRGGDGVLYNFTRGVGEDVRERTESVEAFVQAGHP